MAPHHSATPRRTIPVTALDVVFLHGLDGDALKTWSPKDTGSFWPRWLAEEFEDVAVWTVDYDAWSSGWRGRSMPMQDRAVNLMAQLQNYGIGERPLCFIIHSMGGLLAKEILLHAAEGRTEFASFAAVTKGVAFLATPHTGSGIVKAIKALGVLYQGTPAVADLERNTPYLRHLNNRYRLEVPPLSVSDPEQSTTTRTAARHDAVRLFTERAAAARPGFTVNAGNCATVARVCQRLDGIPLAPDQAVDHAIVDTSETATAPPHSPPGRPS